MKTGKKAKRAKERRIEEKKERIKKGFLLELSEHKEENLLFVSNKGKELFLKLKRMNTPSDIAFKILELMNLMKVCPNFAKKKLFKYRKINEFLGEEPNHKKFKDLFSFFNPGSSRKKPTDNKIKKIEDISNKWNL